MEEIREMDAPVEEQELEGYVPRPAWQVWAARIGLVLFIAFVAMQLMSIARGGL